MPASTIVKRELNIYFQMKKYLNVTARVRCAKGQVEFPVPFSSFALWRLAEVRHELTMLKVSAS